MKKLFILSASVRKDYPGRVEMSIAQGYRIAETREEAIGSFFEHCKTTYPGFSIAQLLDMEVSTDHVLLAAREHATVNLHQIPEINSI